MGKTKIAKVQARETSLLDGKHNARIFRLAIKNIKDMENKNRYYLFFSFCNYF
jgi:hypothetical protein